MIMNHSINKPAASSFLTETAWICCYSETVENVLQMFPKRSSLYEGSDQKIHIIQLSFIADMFLSWDLQFSSS